MKIPPLPFTVTDWETVTPTLHPGETGHAIWRALNIGDIRVRQVEYSANYLANHWCDRGQIFYALEGELTSELKDGRKTEIKAGISNQVSAFGDAAHRSLTIVGQSFGSLIEQYTDDRRL